MRRLVITEQRLSEKTTMYTVETSAGVRATGASLGSALAKLWGGPEDRPPDYVEFEKLLQPIFNNIRDAGGDGQIHKGVQS